MTIQKNRSSRTPSSRSGFSLISKEKLLQLYTALLKCRMLEARIRSLCPGKGRDYLSPSGREASAAGILIDLLPEDALLTSRYDLACRFLKGVPLQSLVSTCFLSEPQNPVAISAGDARINLLPCFEKFADRLHAAAGAAKRGGRGKWRPITVLMIDSKEAVPKLWKPALHSAAASRLPILFVCHSMGEDRDLVHQAEQSGMPGIRVDQEDVVAMYRVASEAIGHARRGSGPTLIECRRWTVNGESEPPRPRGGLAIANMEAYLSGKGLLSRAYKAETTAQFRRELDEAAALTRFGRLSGIS
jgi:pyruvate dehydrogenase E1 component alpha subunit